MNEDIPAFLRLTAAERRASWKGRRLTNGITDKPDKQRWDLPRTIDAVGMALHRQTEHAKTVRAKARRAALKERARHA
jgi:hypothetical protein